MMNLCCDVIRCLSGKTLSTAESCTGGGIGAALTAVPGSSAVFKGGVISYTNWVKHTCLGLSQNALDTYGAVSSQVAREMATGVRNVMQSDVAVSVTGIAGPGSDDFGNPVGKVFIGYADENQVFAREFQFSGNREAVRNQAICAALQLILEVMA